MHCRRVFIGLVVAFTLLILTIPSLPVYAWGDSADPGVAPDEADKAAPAPDLPKEAVVLPRSGSPQQVCWHDKPGGGPLIMENCSSSTAP